MRAPPELRQGTQSSSRILLVPPIDLQQVALGPFELQRETRGSSRVAAVDLWRLSSFSDASSHVAAGWGVLSNFGIVVSSLIFFVFLSNLEGLL